jgi:hypothetical protein
MHLIDPTQRLDGDFDPPALGIEPGGSQLVRLKLKATNRQWERRARTIPFRVDADQQGAPTAVATGTFVQGPVLPDRLGMRLTGLVLGLGALGGAWFGLVRPAIDDAAADAVSEIEIPTAPAATVDPQQPVTSTTVAEGEPGTGGGTAIVGEPLFVTLPSGVPVNSTGEPQPFTVPAGKRLLITDLAMRNPFNDEGTAIITIGDSATNFAFNLITLADGFDWQQSFRTPIELLEGEAISLQVTCSLVGQQGGAGCSAAATFSGTLVDV